VTAPAPSFPRQHARTRRFTLGVPRGFEPGVGPHGPLVLFLRSDTGTDPVTHLWMHDPTDGTPRKLVDARELGDDGELPAEERARRERAREQAGGIVAYAVDAGFTLAPFALAGRLYTVTLPDGEVVAHPTAGPAFDPRPSPDGSAVAYHAGDGLHLVDLHDGRRTPGTTRELVSEPEVAWGRAEFVAAEEMGRSRGFWWSADGASLAVARVDERDVPRWTIADPAQPWAEPTTHRYPAAGTTNAEVTLFVVDAATGARTEVRWDRSAGEYLAAVGWGDDPLTLLVQPRDQRTARCLTADPTSGTTTLVRTWSDPCWVELVPGTPSWHDGHLLTVEDRHDRGPGGTRTLCMDGVPISPPGLQVRELLGVRAGAALVAASEADPTSVATWAVDLDDAEARPFPEDRPADGIVRVVSGKGGGEHEEGVRAPDVVVTSTLETTAPVVRVRWAHADPRSPGWTDLEVVADTPVLKAEPRLLTLGPRRLHAALLLPRDDDGTSPLPVLLDPYGGPHAQRVVRSGAAHLTSQWLADQGFAVLVVDGRGSPGRGPAWERAVHRDLATPVLDDQIDALHAAADLEPRLDLRRVALRGWSFGGYLAALAVLRRPDVIQAAIAGAPVTDWRLYDTHYTERYLGHPDVDPDAYAVSSVVDGEGTLLGAAAWPDDDPPALLLIHGLADDNVVAAHTLRLSQALLAAGHPHQVLPLTGVTHMTPQEVVAEHLLIDQVRFLHDVLGRDRDG
jgi:dipeptidyl-peptidase 4